MYYEQLIHDRAAELRREAATYRLVSRAHRVTPRWSERAARRMRSAVLRRPVRPIGCQA